ncbi:MAG: cytochrome D1 domain-containing protein [Planctomycetota bacterium]
MSQKGTCRLLSLAVCAMAITGSLVAEEPGEHLGPCALVASGDGETLYVACRDARQVAWVDVAAGTLAGAVEMPGEPTGLVLSPDGSRLYVTCADAESVVVVLDAASREIMATIAVGHTAMGPAIAPDGARLYVPNRFDGDVSVVDLMTAREVARVAAVREPVDAAVTPDGKTVLVVNQLPDGPADTFDVSAGVTFIDTGTLQTTTVRLPNGSTGLRHVCLSPDGRHAYVTHTLANYQLVPTVVTGGWTNHNVLSVLDTSQKRLIDTVFLDELDLGAGNPWGVAATADGKSIVIAHAGSRELSVIDAAGLLAKLESGLRNSPIQGGSPYYPGILGVLGRRVKLDGAGPRAVALVGSRAFVAGLFSDTIEVVDTASASNVPLDLIRLGPEPRLTERERGEMLFHDATICFQQWQSCATCHPDARTDGLNWDLLNDGAGNPKNTRSMLLAHATPPAMSAAVRPTAEEAVRSGIQHILFTMRPEEDAAAIDEYLKSLRPVPSPYLVDGRLSPAAERGRRLFESRRVGCAVCHPAPLYTDLDVHGVGSRRPYDQRAEFDTPTLIEVWRTAPYLHDGSYVAVKDLLRSGEHGNTHGRIDRLDDREIDDLVEFVLSL